MDNLIGFGVFVIILAQLGATLFGIWSDPIKETDEGREELRRLAWLLSH